MRSDRVVVVPPTFNDDLGFAQRVEDFTIEQFVARARVEALDIAVLPRAAWRYVGVFAPTTVIHSCTALATNSGPLSDPMWPGMPRRIRQQVDGLELAGDPDRQAFMGELVDHVRCSGRSRMQNPSVSHSLLRLGCLWGTFSPSRRQIRSIRSSLTIQPACSSNPAILL
jgi:hypothetical protein